MLDAFPSLGIGQNCQLLLVVEKAKMVEQLSGLGHGADGELLGAVELIPVPGFAERLHEALKFS